MTLSKSTSTTAETGTLTWDKNGTPISSNFDDVYFSKVSGMAESRHVFLDGNDLERRLPELAQGSTFTIAETGFGTGLNFFCTWQLFDQKAPANSQLHFISTEKYPLSKNDIQRALNVFPQLQSYINEFCQQYTLPAQKALSQTALSQAASPQKLCLARGRVRLTLLFGDVLDTLPTLTDKVNAWFLDGFAPAKNPSMWLPELFAAMSSHSAEQATCATFTAAGIVRQGLNRAGFFVQKRIGFGTKRDMLRGEYQPNQNHEINQQPWFAPSTHQNPEQSAIVIGGGLAGTSCARALAERGWQVEIIERHNSLASEASGNPQGVLYAKLSADNTPLSQFILNGYHYTLNTLDKLQFKDWQQCGVIQLATSDKIAQRHRALDQQHPDSLLQYMDKQQLAERAGFPVNHEGLFFPQAGWVNPSSLCRTMADHPGITITTNREIHEIRQEGNHWLLFDNNQQELARTRTLIIAEGTSSNLLSQLQHLPLKSIRGQVSQVRATPESKALSSCVCGDGYIAPTIDGYHTMGATFNFKDDNPEITDKDHHKNLGMQAHWFPAMYQAMGGKDSRVTGGRVGFRCTTPDYLPVVGAMVDYPQFIEQYAPLRKNLKHRFSNQVPYLDGLYITAGHGSRGLLSCPLAGELLAALICNDSTPLDSTPLDEPLLNHLNPTRFLVRALARNQI